MLVSEAVDLWLTPRADGTFVGAPVSPRTRDHRESMTLHIRETIGGEHWETLGAPQIWRLQQLLDGTVAGSTINAITHNILRAMLRDLDADPAILGRVRKAKKVRERRTPRCMSYDEPQRDAAIEALAGHWGYPIGAFLFLTGCRIGEAAGLRWGDVDFARRQLVIEESRSGLETGDCKNEGSQRVVGMPEKLAEILDALPKMDPSERVLRGRHGRPFDIHTFRAQVWYPRLEAAGLPRLVPHGARHTYATLALTNGIRLSQVAAHLGDTMKTVEKTYAHVLPKFDPNEAVGHAPPTVLRVVAERAEGVPRVPWLRLVKG
jgi:integrase